MAVGATLVMAIGESVFVGWRSMSPDTYFDAMPSVCCRMVYPSAGACWKSGRQLTPPPPGLLILFTFTLKISESGPCIAATA